MEDKHVQLLCIYFIDAPDATTFVKGIFKDDFLDQQLNEKVATSFKWMIDNKYFTADISVYCCSEKILDDIKLDELKEIEAVLLICNVNDENNLKRAKDFVSSIEEKDPEICLLLSSEEVKDANLKDDIFAFCIDNHFEFVETIETVEEEEEEDDEEYGIDRVIQALNSHVWNGNVMKGDHDLVKDISGIIDDCSDIPAGDESFEELFSKFLSMKEKAKTLGEEERRAYAEKVSLAFMEALGIEEEESDENANG